MDQNARRRALFGACHTLGLDDDARRDLVHGLTGKRSTRDLTEAEWMRVLDHINRSTHPDAGKPTTWRPGCEALGAKLGALLASQRLPWRYLTHGKADDTGVRRVSMVKRIAGVERIEFADADGLRGLIVALTRRAQKAARAD